MKYLIALCCLFGVVYSQHINGHDLNNLVDHAFDRLNAGDTDQTVELDEFERIEYRTDTNNDSCVTPQEFQTSRANMPAEIRDAIYKVFDQDHDQCIEISDLVAEFHIIDHDHDNVISRHEFDHYFTQLVHKASAHIVG